ncbi:hypothetical protein Agub_g9928, partial [Astrephomene gubernaculifera]
SPLGELESRRLLLLHQQPQQPHSQLLSSLGGGLQDDLAARINERRAALIRQQLLQHPHRPLPHPHLPLLHKQPPAPPAQHHPHTRHLQHQLPLQDPSMLQEPPVPLGPFGDVALLGLTPSEQLQLRMLAAGQGPGGGRGSMEEV